MTLFEGNYVGKMQPESSNGLRFEEEGRQVQKKDTLATRPFGVKTQKKQRSTQAEILSLLFS